MLEFLQYAFFRNALLGVLLMSLALSVAGTYIVTRRLVFVSGGITHASFGGLGLGYYAGVSPVAVAMIFAAAGALGVQWMSRSRLMRNDTAIGALWGMGMAVGTLFVFLSEGYVPELTSFLFGNVLTTTRADLWILGSFTAIYIIFFLVLRRMVIAVAFDADFSRTRHLPVRLMETLLTLLMTAAIVLAIRMAGIMLLMSLVTLPQLTAGLFTRRYCTMLALSAAVSMAACAGGLMAATVVAVPASAFIVLLLGAVYALCLAGKKTAQLIQVRRING